MPNKNYDQAFAIIRIDLKEKWYEAPERFITITKVLWDEKAADDEVARLRTLNKDKRCTYFAQLARVSRRSVGEVDVTEVEI